MICLYEIFVYICVKITIMRTTYINDKGIKCGFIISDCGRWVDCFLGNESNIINSFFTFGRDGSSISRPNITPQYNKTEIALQQRFGVLFRGQKLVVNECDSLNISEEDLERFQGFSNKKTYYSNFIDHLNTLVKDRDKTVVFYKELLDMNKLIITK